MKTSSNATDSATSSDAGMIASAAEILEGRSKKRGLARLLPFLGPAFIASVAYMDPGNFATNIQGGAQFGYLLLWVVVASNLMAMLIQTLSAKLGIATGLNLAEQCRDHFPRWVVMAMWVLDGSSWPWPPTWRSSWARRWASTSSSASRSGWPAS